MRNLKIAEPALENELMLVAAAQWLAHQSLYVSPLPHCLLSPVLLPPDSQGRQSPTQRIPGKHPPCKIETKNRHSKCVG
jgi:hypothetical protein